MNSNQCVVQKSGVGTGCKSWECHISFFNDRQQFIDLHACILVPERWTSKMTTYQENDIFLVSIKIIKSHIPSSDMQMTFL